MNCRRTPKEQKTAVDLCAFTIWTKLLSKKKERTLGAKTLQSANQAENDALDGNGNTSKLLWISHLMVSARHSGDREDGLSNDKAKRRTYKNSKFIMTREAELVTQKLPRGSCNWIAEQDDHSVAGAGAPWRREQAEEALLALGRLPRSADLVDRHRHALLLEDFLVPSGFG